MITQFVDEVISRVLRNYKIESNSDMDTVKKEVRRLYKEKYSVSQAYIFVCCMEEVNPFLTEEEALEMMSKKS